MIARKSALIIATQLSNGLLGYAALKFIAVYMEAWQYGIIGFAYGFVALFSIFGNLGFNQAHIKKVSEGKDLGNCIATFASIKLFLAALMSSILILSIIVWKYVMGRGFETSLHEEAVYLMLSYFVLLILTQTMITTFNARKEIAKAQIPLFAYSTTRAIATIFVAVEGLGVLALAYTYVFGEIFHFMLALWFFRGYPVGKPSLSYLKEYISFAFPMAIASASYIIMTNLDKVFIQLFWSAKDVGFYFAIFNLSRFIILFANSVGTLLFPTISEYHANKNFGGIEKLTVQSERYLSMIVFPIIVIMVVMAEPIIRILLSNRYYGAIPILHILPFFVLLEALSRPYVSLFSGMNMPKIARNRILIAMIINVILNILLIPRDIKMLGLKLAGMGAEGAAIATVISYLAGLIYLRFMAWKIAGIKGGKSIFIHGLTAAFTGYSLWNMEEIVSIERWYHLLGTGIAGMAIYFAILAILKEFRKEDFDLFADTLNPKKMMSYIWEEIKGKKK